MAYKIDSAWERGQTITAERLNHMEKGIASALNAIGKAFGKEYDDESNEEYTVSLENLGSEKSIAVGAITGTTIKGTTFEGTTFKTTGATEGYTLNINGTSGLNGDVDIGGILTVGKNETGKTKDTTLNGKLSVMGLSDLKNELDVTGISNLKGGLNVGTSSTKKDATINGELIVDGAPKAIAWNEQGQVTSSTKKAATLNGLVTIKGNVYLSDENTSIFLGDYNNPNITCKYDGTIIANKLLIDNSQAGTVEFKTLTNQLHGTTTIDKLAQLIVGDASTIYDIENKIYGTTSIYGTTTIYNTLQIGTYGPQDFWPNPEEPRIEQFGVQGTLKIFSDIQIGLTGDEEGIGTKQLVNTNTHIHGNTTIDNLIIGKSIRTDNGEHVNVTYAGNATFYTSQTTFYGSTTINDLTVNNLTSAVATINGTSNIFKRNIHFIDYDDNDAGFLLTSSYYSSAGSLILKVAPYIQNKENENIIATTKFDTDLIVTGETTQIGSSSVIINPSDNNSQAYSTYGNLKIYSDNIRIGLSEEDLQDADRDSIEQNSTTYIYGTTTIDNLTIKGNLTVTNGTDTVTLSIKNLQDLKNLLS